jgi:hypothetical protein
MISKENGQSSGVSKILERFDRRLCRISPEGIRDELSWSGWGTWDKRTRGKCLPYWDQQSLDEMHRVGCELARDTTVQSLISSMVSYVINKGWRYSVVPSEGSRIAESSIDRLSAALQSVIRLASLGTRTSWLVIQKESYRRLLRDGEFFRQWWITEPGKLEVRFIEPCDIRQPKEPRTIRNRDTLPTQIQLLFYPDGRPPGEFGIVSDPDDANRILGFWRRRWIETPGRFDKEEVFDFLPASRVQHAKDGVDENDPRGVPAFYDGLCHVKRINEVDEAMAALAVTQSEYAAVVTHKTANRREAIRSLTQAREQEVEEASRIGKRVREIHLKNADLTLPGMSVRSAEFIEILQQEQRLLGNLRQIPEFISTADANTGNRSSLVAAESPFARRISSDQQLSWDFDQDLLWAGITNFMQMDSIRAQSTMAQAVLTPSFPLPDTRDRAKDSEMVTSLVKANIFSPQEASRVLGVEYAQMTRELEKHRAEHPDLTPEPQKVASGALPSQRQQPISSQ